MNKIPYTKDEFDKHYFFYSGNNHPFIRATLLREYPSYDEKLSKMFSFISPGTRDKHMAKCKLKLGEPNFSDEYDNDYHIFDLNGDIFYYKINNHHEGNTIGMMTDKNFHVREKTNGRNWLFHPSEYDWQDSVGLKNRFVNFTTSLYNYLN